MTAIQQTVLALAHDLATREINPTIKAIHAAFPCTNRPRYKHVEDARRDLIDLGKWPYHANPRPNMLKAIVKAQAEKPPVYRRLGPLATLMRESDRVRWSIKRWAPEHLALVRAKECEVIG